MKWFGRTIYTQVNGTEQDDQIDVDQISFTSSCSSGENQKFEPTPTCLPSPDKQPDLISFDSAELPRATESPVDFCRDSLPTEKIVGSAPGPSKLLDESPKFGNPEEEEEEGVDEEEPIKESIFVRNSVFWFNDDEVDKARIKVRCSNRGRVCRFPNDVDDDHMETVCRSLQVTMGLTARSAWLNEISNDPYLSSLAKELDQSFALTNIFGEPSSEIDLTKPSSSEDSRNHAPSASSLSSAASGAFNIKEAPPENGRNETKIVRIVVPGRPGIEPIEIRRRVNTSCEQVCSAIIKHSIECDEPRDSRMKVLMNRFAKVRPESRHHDNYAPEVPPLAEDWILHVQKVIPIRVGIKAQHEKCACCRQYIYMTSTDSTAPAKFCEYYGLYFCHLCHAGEKSIVPSKILTAWNFAEVPVCDRALRFLNAVREVPVFRMRIVAPETVRKTKLLRHVMDLRLKLRHMEQFIKVCSAAANQITEYGNLGTMFAVLDRYLLDCDDLFSLNDLLRVYNKDLPCLLEPIAKHARAHIMNCKGCCARAHVCVRCNELSDRLFPFEDRVNRCDECGGLSHAPKCPRRDVPKDSACPKCARISKTRSRQRILANSLAEWSFPVVWSSLVILFILKYIIKKPWGVHVQYRDAVRRNDLKRLKGFEDFENATLPNVVINDERIKANRENLEELKEAFRRIVSLPLLELREKLQNGELNAFTVLCAYVHKAMEVQKRINCCTEVIKEAFDYATEADRKWENSKEKPPLYGIPFSVKSNFYMKGYDCSIGVAKLLDQPKDQDTPFVAHLINLGAVPFVLTNVPQGLLSFVSSNTVYGTTLNPHDLTRVPGGSSGGEAALLAGGGSAFGTGSDLAGSLRIPASLCGLTTLKPTQDRFVVTHTHGGVPGRGRLGLSFGFFTKTVEEQIFLLKLIVGSEEYRKLLPQSPPAPLRMEIGYFEADGFCPPVPSHRRAVLDTIEKLKKDGHQAVKFDIPRVMEAALLFYKNVMPDSGSYMRSIYENEEIDENMKQFVMLLKVPRTLRWVAARILSGISPQMSLICDAYMRDVEDVRYTQELTDKYRLDFIKYWKELGIDVLVCPSFIVPAVPHKYPSKLSTAGFATGLFNLLDFPAGVVPTGHVTNEDDADLHDDKFFNVGYNPILKVQREAASCSVGLPNSVQIVTLPYEEEMCLHAMKIVEELWKCN
ncbi:unnamed protein product [Caenorhabditis bovis]|uniref:Rubicon Homology domain-containing protein n=1 Tax=Caenorhabditis bovis TaxID=2654633 RepID=A0A8S1EN26_9PELO|nr:unnamed protein product [Caenorhabditis bovis]